MFFVCLVFLYSKEKKKSREACVLVGGGGFDFVVLIGLVLYFFVFCMAVAKGEICLFDEQVPTFFFVVFFWEGGRLLSCGPGCSRASIRWGAHSFLCGVSHSSGVYICARLCH